MGVRVNIVVAMANNRVIGRKGELPWKISADLKRFKQITLGHSIVMGRKTFESLPRVLPGRKNIIVSNQHNYQHPKLDDQCVVVKSLEAAIALPHETNELMVIGGAVIYQHALSLATRVFLTNVHAEVAGDVYFPEFAQAWWTLTDRSALISEPSAEYGYSFSVLERA